jgi:CRP-like cAMP-binding protein
MINIDILITYGGNIKKVKKGEIIFFEGDHPRYFYQILEGEIKMFNTNDNGKEFTQGVFGIGECFGEPPLFINEEYPSTAIALKDSLIIRVFKDNFLKLIEDYPDIQKCMLREFAQRIYNKSILTGAIVNNPPEARIMGILNSIKKDAQKTHEKQMVKYTRQELANLTGLRVETVIRTLKKMDVDKKVSIINHKLYY